MIKDNIDKLIAEAMKQQGSSHLNVLRAIKTVLVNFEKEGKTLTEADEVKLLLKMKAQRQDSIEQYEAAGRYDLANAEVRELAVLESFIPAQPTDEDITKLATYTCDKLIAENGGLSMRDMKQVLSLVQAKYPTATGKVVSQVVKSKITE